MPTVIEIISANYNPLMDAVIQLINGWTKLPVSLIGRIDILKMKILPKYLNLFQSIPLSPPLSVFQSLKKTFLNFIWNNKRPRLRLSLSYLPYDRGGLKLPNLLWYFWATQIRASMIYFVKDYPPVWVTIESHAILDSCHLKNLKPHIISPQSTFSKISRYEVS